MWEPLLSIHFTFGEVVLTVVTGRSGAGLLSPGDQDAGDGRFLPRDAAALLGVHRNDKVCLAKGWKSR